MTNGFKRTSFDIFISKRNFNRLQSGTHTRVEVLRLEGFEVTGDTTPDGWGFEDSEAESLARVAGVRMKVRDEYGNAPSHPDFDERSARVVEFSRRFVKGVAPHVRVSERAGLVDVRKIGFQVRPKGEFRRVVKSPLRARPVYAGDSSPIPMVVKGFGALDEVLA